MFCGGTGSLIFVILSFVFVGGTFANVESFVGCYKDHDIEHRRLPHHLFTERGQIDWTNKSYFCGLIKRCAEKAYNLNYTYYGIEFYGECWAGHQCVSLGTPINYGYMPVNITGKECNVGGRRVICVYTQYVEPEDCGQRSSKAPSSDDRIVGGYEATPNSWPWMVQMVKLPYQEHLCGASLIDPCCVMTAAHCVEGLASSQIGFYAGSHNIATGNNLEQYRTGQIISHRQYNGYTYANDIALIKLDEPFLINDFVHPVCLPDDSTEFLNGTLCTVTGWGRTNYYPPKYLDVLMEVKVKLVLRETCNQPKSYNGEVHQTSLCAGFPKGGKDSCTGDSGGPLMCESAGGTWTQVGIVSWGYKCAEPNKYGVYSDVKKLLPFINSWC